MDYKSERWRGVRGRILRRDRYLCRECRRYGRTAQATTVHHAWPADEYPEWRYEDWNLVSLCSACHNAMHERDRDGTLTDVGRYWQRRCTPPSSKGGL